MSFLLACHTHTLVFMFYGDILDIPITENLLHFYILKNITYDLLTVFLIGTKTCPNKEKDFRYCQLCEDIM